MTISKKLLIVASLALGLQLSTSAYFSATALKTEVTSILDFIDVLSQETTKDAQKAVQLLEKEFRSEKEDKYGWDRYTLDDVDVIDMARIIEMSLTTDAKVVEILAILARKEAAKEQAIKRQYQENLPAYIAAGALGILCVSVLCHGFYKTITQQAVAKC